VLYFYCTTALCPDYVTCEDVTKSRNGYTNIGYMAWLVAVQNWKHSYW